MKFRTPTTLLAALEQIGRIRRDVRLLMWSFVVLAFPFYVFDSGVPQPADWVGLLLLPVLLRHWNGRLPAAMVGPLRILVLFVIYVFIVNVAWSLILFTFSTNAKDGFLMAPTYYLFNAMMFFTFVLMFQRYGEFLLWLTVRLVLISVFLQAGLSFVVSGASGRSTVMFNNPNQLGYYALLSACIILLGQKRLQLSTLQVTAGLAACSYLTLLSASKAALVSVGVLGITLMLTKLRTIIGVTIVFAALIYTSNPFSAAIDKTQHRIEHDESYGLLEERGYDRITAFPEYTIVGAGEGGYRRFKEVSMIGSHELHSSIATLFFCYGIVGVGLFAMFMWGTLSGAGVRAWVIVGAGFAYGMTHQGLRFRILWTLLGMVCALRELETRERIARAFRKVAA